MIQWHIHIGHYLQTELLDFKIVAHSQYILSAMWLPVWPMWRFARISKATPIAFFDMQVKVEASLPKDLQGSLDSLYRESKTYIDKQGHPRIRSTDYDDFNYRSYIDPGLKEYKTNAHRAISISFKAISTEYGTNQPSASQDKLQAIICSDEARALQDLEL